MAIHAPVEGGKPIDTTKLHPSVCTAVVVLGTQVSQFGEAKKLWLQFELQDEEREFDGKPYRVKVGQIFTLSVGPKSNLRKFLEGWRGTAMSNEEAAALDIARLLGKPCNLLVEEVAGKGGKTYTNITAVKPFRAVSGAPAMIPMAPQVLFEMNPGEPLPTTLPRFIIEMVSGAPEFKCLGDPGTVDHAPPEAVELSAEETNLPF